MDIKYNKQKLSKILEDIYQLLKTPISIFDKDFQFLTAYPPEGQLTKFCSIIREDAERIKKCHRSDKESCEICQQTNRTFSYLCHAGIWETITPICFENMILGYIIFGEYRIEGKEKDISAYAIENGMDKERLKNAYEQLILMTEKQVSATCNILQSCILQFWMSEAILLKEDELVERIKSFIEQNLSEPLTAEALCKNFFLNRQQLYVIFKERFNTSVKRYVLKKKIGKAKELLKTTEYSVTEIAEKTGFSDYNNFIQRFKKTTGLTPLQYRKNNA